MVYSVCQSACASCHSVKHIKLGVLHGQVSLYTVTIGSAFMHNESSYSVYSKQINNSIVTRWNCCVFYYKVSEAVYCNIL